MEYKNIVKRELKGFLEEFNYYSLGEALYSILRINSKGVDLKVLDIKNLSDEDMYRMIVKAKEIESKDDE